MRGERLLSTEGLFSLEVDARWRWEQTSEDGSFVFHDPHGHGLIRFAETLGDSDPVLLLPDGAPCSVNGFAACYRVTVGEGRRTRRWVVGDGRSLVDVCHEGPSAAGSVDDEAVDALLSTLVLHRAPHPTVAALLRLLADSDAGDWVWRPESPLVLACPALDVELGVEALVRTVDVAPQTLNVRLAEEARRIRNLALFHRGRPLLDEVADSLLPVVRSGVIRETFDERIRSIRADATVKLRLLCGGDLARRLFAPGLFVYFGVDVPGAFQFVTPELRAAWGVAVGGLEVVAVENLRRRLAADRLEVVRHGEHRIVVVEDGEGLASSRLLLPSFRQSLTRLLHGPWRVALPSAGVMIAFSRGFDDWLSFLGEDVWEAYLHEPVPLTEQVYDYDGGDLFIPLGPPSLGAC